MDTHNTRGITSALFAFDSGGGRGETDWAPKSLKSVLNM